MSVIISVVALCACVIAIIMSSVALWLGSTATDATRQMQQQQQQQLQPGNLTNTPANVPNGFTVQIVSDYTLLIAPNKNQAYDANVPFSFLVNGVVSSRYQITTNGLYMFIMNFIVQNWNGIQGYSIMLNNNINLGQLSVAKPDGLTLYGRTTVAQLVVGDTIQMVTDTTGAFNGVSNVNTLEIVKL
jgi:hypothetical protein